MTDAKKTDTDAAAATPQQSAFDHAFELLMLNETSFTPQVLEGIEPGDSRYKLVFSDDPSDNGGETKYGISKRAFPQVDVRNLTVAEAKEIYREHYWTFYRCGEMPWAIGWVYFDCVVNHDPHAPAQWLQRALGVTADGQVGKNTFAAIKAAKNPIAVARDMTLARRDYCEQLHNYDHFKAGWNRRQLDTLIGAVLWE